MKCSICALDDDSTRPRIQGNSKYKVCELCWDSLWDEDNPYLESEDRLDTRDYDGHLRG